MEICNLSSSCIFDASTHPKPHRVAAILLGPEPVSWPFFWRECFLLHHAMMEIQRKETMRTWIFPRVDIQLLRKMIRTKLRTINDWREDPLLGLRQRNAVVQERPTQTHKGVIHRHRIDNLHFARLCTSPALRPWQVDNHHGWRMPFILLNNRHLQPELYITKLCKQFEIAPQWLMIILLVTSTQICHQVALADACSWYSNERDVWPSL